MNGGYCAFFKTTLVLLVITSVILIQCMSLCVGKAEAWADINSLANKSTRHYTPLGYENNGSAIEKVVHFKGVRGIGNVGIGNGSLLTLVSDVTLDPSAYMLPKKYMAGDIVMNGASPSLVIGKPQKDIFHEFPLEAGAMYGKLLGFRMPGGNRMDMGIRTIGYGYYDPKRVGEKIGEVSTLLNTLKNGSTATG